MKVTRRALLKIIRETLDINTFDVDKVEDKASKAFDIVEKIVKLTVKMKVKNVTKYLGSQGAGYYLKNTEQGKSHANLSKVQDYLFRADDLFHKIKDNTMPQMEAVQDFGRSANRVKQMLQRFDFIHSGKAAKMFGAHNLGGYASDPGITEKEFENLKSLQKKAIVLYDEIIGMCSGAQEAAPGESDQTDDMYPTSPTSPTEPAKPAEPKPGGQASKKKKGWSNHPPEMKAAWLAFLKAPDYKKVHGPKGGTYREWQRWYMTATKDPQSWELLGTPQKKYLNSDQVTKILKMLADPSSINESLSRGSLYRNRYRRY